MVNPDDTASDDDAQADEVVRDDATEVSDTAPTRTTSSLRPPTQIQSRLLEADTDRSRSHSPANLNLPHSTTREARQLSRVREEDGRVEAEVELDAVSLGTDLEE